MKQRFKFKKTLISGFVCLALLGHHPLIWSYDTASLEQSTKDLIILSGETTSGKKFTPEELTHWIKTVKTRQQALRLGLKDDPTAVIKFLLPKKMVAQLPKQITPYVEKEVNNIQGTVELRIGIAGPHDKEFIDYLVHAKDGTTYYLHFTGQPLEGLETKAVVKIKKAYQLQRSEKTSDIVVTAEDVIIEQKAPLALPEAFGPQKTIVILVNFQDRPNDKPFTIAQAKTNHFTNLSNMYYESSYHQTTVVGDAVGWFTIPINSTDSCDRIYDDLSGYADAAATAAGVDFSQFTRKMYLFPRFNNCSWGGYGSIGRWDNWSYAWLNGENSPYLSGHEMGHNMGLYHSQLLNCGSQVNTGNCTRITYGDLADIIGYGNTAHFNAFQKDRLGWLNYQSSPPIQTVNTSGTYTIPPYEVFNNTPKALKIVKSVLANGSTDYYYLEFRQPIGFDSHLGCSNCDFTKGILVHQGNSVNADSSNLLDFSPGDNNRNLVALLPGKSFTDPSAPNGGVTFTVNSVSSAGANVTITFGSTPPPVCTRVNQTFTISPTTTQYVSPGGSANYTVTVKNNDSAACSSSTFTIAATPPANVTASLNTTSLALAPGATGNATLQVGSSSSTPAGIYSVPVKSTSNAISTNVATVNASFGVQTQTCTRANPTVSLSPTSQTGAPEATLTYTMNVKNNDSTGCSTSTFSITSKIPRWFTGTLSPASLSIAPGATLTSQFAVTSALNAKDGNFTIQATATNNTSTQYKATAQATWVVQR